ncbi:MAG TPA: hypothetical protein VHB68_01380 [Steroidobacteraceae bacterium]|nr:hypothetical protein [Steroidobacteraceae bacterium]
MRNQTQVFLMALLAFALACIGTVPAVSTAAVDPRTINPHDYPSLDAKELGSLRRFVKLARSLPGDFAGMSDDLYAIAERTQQFQYAYMAAAVGLIQYEYTPAYRELYRRTMDELIQKMTLPDIWESWLKSSRSGTAEGDPDLPDMTVGWLDPVRRYNNMLKGYLLQAGAMYDMLYRDGRYDKADAFTFRHAPRTWGNGTVVFRYSLPDVARIVHQEYVDNHYEGVLCEPNRVFPACNQPPILGLINFDQTHGTHYAADVMPKFTAVWKRKGYTMASTGQNIHFVYVRQGKLEQVGTPVLDGWAGAWMHAWNPDLMQEIYPRQHDLYLPMYMSGAWARRVPQQNKGLLSLGYGQVAFMVAEMGDTDARQKMLDYAERNFHPVWEEGAYYYPRNDDYTPDAQGNSHGVGSWTGNVLIALARLDKGGSFLRLYRKPWTKAELEAPEITDVDELSVNVSQAYYDAARKALIVTIEPGPVKAAQTSFVVRRLPPGSTYLVLEDGVVVKDTNRVQKRPDGTLAISTTLDKSHSFVIVAA